jgi:hypothetical protein
MRYLSTQPVPIESIGESDIKRESLSIDLTSTEDLVTKLTTTWKIDYAIDKSNTLILRHNVKKYGTQEAEDDYYQFNILDLVRKSATFWLIRKSNTWKRIRFSTSLEFLNLEAFDPIEFTLPDVADGPFTGLIEKAVYNSADNTIEFTAWTPIRSGTRTVYDFAWPADVSEQQLFPTIEDRNAGFAGSGTNPNFSTIAPPGHPLDTPQTYFTSASLACNGNVVDNVLVEGSDFSTEKQCRQDHGDKNPSDEGDTKPEPPWGTNTEPASGVSVGTSPITNGAGTGFWSNTQTQKDETERVASQAAAAHDEAERAVNNDGSDEQSFDDAFDNLPDPDDLDPDEYPCQVRVTVSGFRTKQAGSVNSPVCVPDGPNFQEIYVFNSTSAAQSFASGLGQNQNCSGQLPCGYCVSVVVTNAGCEPPEGEGQAIIGFSTTGSGPPLIQDIS